MIMAICDIPDVLKVVRLVKIAINIIKIVVPIMLIVSVMIDLLKDVSEGGELSKTGSLVVKKIIAAVVVFLIPTIVSIIFNIVGANTEYKRCLDLATSTNINASYEIHMSKLMEEFRHDLNNNNFANARAYLNNIQNEGLKNNYLEELKTLKAQLDAQSKISDFHLSSIGSGILDTAKKVWDKIVNGSTKFGYGASQIPPSSQVDCSGFVSWVLYEYGYEDFKGSQSNTSTLFNTNYKEKYGWEELYFKGGTNLANVVRPGDIVIRDVNGKGHANIIISEDKANNRFKVYDCGNADYVSNGAHPDGVYANDFIFNDSRPAKIIRVTPAV